MPAILAAAQKREASVESTTLRVLALRTANAIVSAVLRSTTERGTSAASLQVRSGAQRTESTSWHAVLGCTELCTAGGLSF